ncbi:hypothetical protein PSP6_170037 [Paraburkholderia tropica]|nr:hypothetical protein PSP6_170037 [Paraburkholderia tropica]
MGLEDRLRQPVQRRRPAAASRRAASRPERRSRGARCEAALARRAFGQAFGDTAAVLVRHDHRPTAQRLQRHVEREHARAQAAARGFVVADLGEFFLEIAQRAQLFDRGRHETGVLQDAVRDPDVFGHERVVVEFLGRSGAIQIVEVTARSCGGNPLFDEGIKQFHRQSTTLRPTHSIRVRPGRPSPSVVGHVKLLQVDRRSV